MILAEDADAYRRIWGILIGSGAPPQVDFSRETAIFFLDRQRNTGGYSLEAHSVAVEGDTASRQGDYARAEAGLGHHAGSDLAVHGHCRVGSCDSCGAVGRRGARRDRCRVGEEAMRLRKPVSEDVLRERLDVLVETFDVSTIEPDPLQLVLRYGNPLDQEVAGLIAAAFAYGRADIIVSNIGALLDSMGSSPFAYLAAFDAREGRKRFRGFSHRFHKTAELVAFLERIASVINEHGSLGELFRKCYDAASADIGPSLDRFVNGIMPPVTRSRGFEVSRCAWPRDLATSQPRDPGISQTLEYLLSSPADGSACKRMNLYLRWMVRRSAPDLGLWDFVDPAKLVIPLDTHVHRIATFLGLNDRKSADWKTARLLTDRLARLDPADPVRYDFALCRLGILDLCSRVRRKENCEVCLLRDACRFPVT